MEVIVIIELMWCNVVCITFGNWIASPWPRGYRILVKPWCTGLGNCWCISLLMCAVVVYMQLLVPSWWNLLLVWLLETIILLNHKMKLLCSCGTCHMIDPVNIRWSALCYCSIRLSVRCVRAMTWELLNLFSRNCM